MYLLQENDRALSLHTRTACRSRPCWLHSQRGAERLRPEAVSHSFWHHSPSIHALEVCSASVPCTGGIRTRQRPVRCCQISGRNAPPIERFVCFCVCRKNPLALRAKMLSRAQFCYLRRSRFSTCCRQVFDTLFNNILYISALQTTMSCGIVHHAAQEAVVATADMHQRRRLSHCTQKTATRKTGGQGAGDNHQGERK